MKVMQIKERIDLDMKIKRLIAFLIACTFCGGVNAFAENIDILEEDIIIAVENQEMEDIGTEISDSAVELLSVDVASTEFEMEKIFEDTYDFENYYADATMKNPAPLNKEDGYCVWAVNQPSALEMRTHMLDVIPANRAGYGDMLRISTVSNGGYVFYGHRIDENGNLLPKVTDGVVVFETDFYVTKESFPTINSMIMMQVMTGNNEQMLAIVIRRDGEKIVVNRSNTDATPIYSDAFPDGDWIKVRVVLDYTIGKWYSVYVDENNASHEIVASSIIPQMINNGAQNTRITYSVDGNSNGNVAQIYTDNYRCYKLNNATTSGKGYFAVNDVLNSYSQQIRLDDFTYSVQADSELTENFSEYTMIPSALTVGTDKKWKHTSGGKYLGASLLIVEDPEDSDKRALFISSGKSGVNQYADTWISPNKDEALCFDGKIRITDENVASSVSLVIQNTEIDNVKLISTKNGKLYAGETELCDILNDKWYSFNMLINPIDNTVFAIVNDGTAVYDVTLENSDISFENPIRLTLGTDYRKGNSDCGVYFTDINICPASNFTCTSEIISKKPELTLKPAIDLNFSNFVNIDEVKKIVISSGEDTVEYDIEYVGNSVKNVKIIPKNDLMKNTTYKVDLSAVRDIIGNALIENELSFKTGDPALMDILDVKKVTLKKNDEAQKYLTSGELTVEINCTNISSEQTDAVVLLMLYDGYIMKDVVIADKETLSVDENKVLSGTINVPGKKSSYRLRACVWDNDENAFALTKSYVFDSTGMIIE